MCGFQKISIPPPYAWRELEIPEGWQGSQAQEIPEGWGGGGGGADGQINYKWFNSIQQRPTAVVVRKLLLTDFCEMF